MPVIAFCLQNLEASQEEVGSWINQIVDNLFIVAIGVFFRVD